MQFDCRYPGSARKQLDGVTINCSLLSRVAIIGPNGAGKSTMVKVLTGELEPSEKDGVIYRHPNVRVAYVAQHAFHHIEEHLDKTPNQYIQWRYAIGEDREAGNKVDRQVTKMNSGLQRACCIRLSPFLSCGVLSLTDIWKLLQSCFMWL